MGWASTGARRGLRNCSFILSALVAAVIFTTHAAEARHHHRGRFHRTAAAQAYAPPTASIVVDGNSGAVLEESNPDAPRHPASLTKVMTLYLLFERLEAGKIKLDTPLAVSEHASEQAPTKLGLKPGQTISVENAIEGIVTRSANDAAVVIAENLGGSESAFARLMTQKARALGMSRTTYVNASGLPDEDQITTARDQALLGRAIQDRFPGYYHFFSTRSFVFRGQIIRGHDHLLGSVPGVDGIKTGFTEASGFNLLTSDHHDGRYVVAVVLGGRSAAERDAHMRALIASNIRLAAVRRSAPAIAERAQPDSGAKVAAFAKVVVQDFAKDPRAPRAEPAPRAAASRVVVGSNAPIRPVVVKTISYRTAPARAPSMKPMPALVPATRPQSPPPVTPAMSPTSPTVAVAAVASIGPLAAVTAPAPGAETAFPQPKAEAAGADIANPIPQAAPHLHNGWVIQIGAYGGEDEARQHLSEAQVKLHGTFAAADPFTESVQKGDTTLFRARFAGFDKATAEAACRELKRSDFHCIALKD